MIPPTSRSRPVANFQVEVDQTGESAIVACTVVDDFGTVINPMIVEGQVHGGIAQGVGQALLEGAVYEDGQLVTGSLMDYCMPRAQRLPVAQGRYDHDQGAVDSLGIKGCGEAGAIAAPVAVINALTDAIGTGWPTPATAQTVWQALQKTKQQGKRRHRSNHDVCIHPTPAGDRAAGGEPPGQGKRKQSSSPAVTP